MTKKISFKNDYSEGAHPDILQQLHETNFEQQPGYGSDQYSEEARRLIREEINDDYASIYFTSGGTQANMLVIGHLLKPYETVICANTGHIAVHEAGAIEGTGHKVSTLPSKDGKIELSDLKKLLAAHTDHHMVKPAMVYISNATELGSIYTKNELVSLSDFCRQNDLLLFMDGARLGMALTAQQNDLSLADIANLVDVFYIGGTKNGALLGEAIVFTKEGLDKDFSYYLKQRGALLAKGRILGIQFLCLFKNGLYYRLASHANLLAAQIAAALDRKFHFFLPPVTNQLFPILPNTLISELSNSFDFYVWQKIDEQHAAVRIVTSWATSEDSVTKLVRFIEQY